jgi:hypothetical protein
LWRSKPLQAELNNVEFGCAAGGWVGENFADKRREFETVTAARRVGRRLAKPATKMPTEYLPSFGGN